MNKQDFTRNFQQSYFGYLNMEAVRKGLEATGYSSDAFDLSSGTIIPMTRPVFPLASRAACTVLATLKHKNTERYEGLSVNLFSFQDDMDEGADFITEVPRSQMVQLKDCSIYVRRSPARDTPRGYCPRYSSSTVISWEELPEDRQGYLESGRPEIVWNLYNSRIPSYLEAINALNNGDRVSCAVGSHLSIGLRAKRRYVQIYYRNRGSVGFIDEDGNPVVFQSHANVATMDYIHKIVGIQPKEK